MKIEGKIVVYLRISGLKVNTFQRRITLKTIISIIMHLTFHFISLLFFAQQMSYISSQQTDPPQSFCVTFTCRGDATKNYKQCYNQPRPQGVGDVIEQKNCLAINPTKTQSTCSPLSSSILLKGLDPSSPGILGVLAGLFPIPKTLVKNVVTTEQIFEIKR